MTQSSRIPSLRVMSQKETEPPSRPPRRRAQAPAPEGTDPHPEAEPERHSEGDNDERLLGDKPPHY